MTRRIVVVNDSCHPNGGAALLAIQSAIAFARQGRNVTFISGDSRNPRLASEGISCVALDQDGLLETGALLAATRGLYNRAAKRLLEDWIERNDAPDTIYHLHGWAQILSPSIFIPLRKVSGRLVISAHDFFEICPNGTMYNFATGVACRLKPMSGACLSTNCDKRKYSHKLWRFARHSLLNWLREDGASMPPRLLINANMRASFRLAGMEESSLAVLPNPITPYCTQRVAAEKNSLALFVGRMEENKGIAEAAEACRRAGVRLIAIGAGAQLECLRTAYPEHQWPGRLEQSEIGQYAQVARFALMPSINNEPFGMTAVEALWSGLPLICSDNGLLAPDIVAAGAGIGIDPRDGNAFAAALAHFRDDAVVEEMSGAAFRDTRQLALSPEDWTRRLLDTYDALVEGGKPAFSRVAAGWG